MESKLHSKKRTKLLFGPLYTEMQRNTLIYGESFSSNYHEGVFDIDYSKRTEIWCHG